MSMQDAFEYEGAPETGSEQESSRPAVVTDNLVRHYGPIRAVDGIDLAIEEGEIYGLLGQNGAGKSTLIRVLCTLLRPSGGRAVVAGYDVGSDPEAVRLRIGVALQDVALDPHQTGRELLRLQGRLYGLRGKEVRRRVDEILDLVDIASAIDRRIGTYSGGMKRRLDLAAALVHGPEILFLDEPTTGLDPESRSNVWDEVRRLNRELGMTIVLTTQYLEEADSLAGRVGFVHRGRLVAEGPPGDLKRRVGDDVITAVVDDADDAIVGQLVSLDAVTAVHRDGDLITIATHDAPASIGPVAIRLERSGLEVRSLTLQSPTLDDVLRHLTERAPDPVPARS
jgi:ABC-2 type transport system ATP-binding protein